MHLIATDPQRRDLGVVRGCSLDMAFGDGENDFELRVPLDGPMRGIDAGSLVYADGTEYGGMVDDVGCDTAASVPCAVYRGPTWHGLLAGRVLRPDPGQDWLRVSGEANAVLLSLVHRVGLEDLFTASGTPSGFDVSYQFARYVDAYSGIRAMLGSAGAKLGMAWDGGRVALSALPVVDHSAREFEGRRTGIRAVAAKRPVNHLVCLGKGELRDRLVVDLYADADGNVSQTQTLFGLDERAQVYDRSSAEAEELLEDGAKRLRELQDADECDVPSLPPGDYGIGDVIGAREGRMGLYVTAEVTKKVVSVGKDGATVTCEAGSPRLRVTQRL